MLPVRITDPPASAPSDIAAHGFMYVACDIPPGMTIDEFRRRRAAKHRPRHFRRPFKH
jgi:hypothetical protein